MVPQTFKIAELTSYHVYWRTRGTSSRHTVYKPFLFYLLCLNKILFLLYAHRPSCFRCCLLFFSSSLSLPYSPKMGRLPIMPSCIQKGNTVHVTFLVRIRNGSSTVTNFCWGSFIWKLYNVAPVCNINATCIPNTVKHMLFIAFQQLLLYFQSHCVSIFCLHKRKNTSLIVERLSHLCIRLVSESIKSNGYICYTSTAVLNEMKL